MLLIDELDRTDEPFEAFLLELLSDFQVTIPRSRHPRRGAPDCGHYLEPHPRDPRRPEAPLLLPGSTIRFGANSPSCARNRPGRARPVARVVAFVQKLRQRDLFKLPGVAETIDWTDAHAARPGGAQSPGNRRQLGALLKYQDDIARIRGTEAAAILRRVRAEMLAQNPPTRIAVR